MDIGYDGSDARFWRYCSLNNRSSKTCVCVMQVISPGGFWRNSWTSCCYSEAGAKKFTRFLYKIIVLIFGGIELCFPLFLSANMRCICHWFMKDIFGNRKVFHMVTQHTTDTRCNHDLACACKAIAFQTCFTLVINWPRDCFNIDKASTAWKKQLVVITRWLRPSKVLMPFCRSFSNPPVAYLARDKKK